MGFRFRKTFNIIKGVKANVSTSGVSFTIGGKGASINTGKNGTYLNLGLPGTGISYRKKIGSTNKTASKTKPKDYKSVSATQEKKNNESVAQYNAVYDQLLNIHKYAADVEKHEAYQQHLATLTSEASAMALNGLIEGNQEYISIAIDNQIQDLKLPYDCNISYELDDETVLLDIDLPEITDMPTEYPTILKDGSILSKKFAQTTIKQNYANTVISLSIYLAANIFNISPYIKHAMISGYTQIRDKNGDQIDQYIYSFDFTRDVFEETELSSIVKPYDFILQFNNRINLSTSFVFKSITPFVPLQTVDVNEEPQSKQEDDTITTTVDALRVLGYKQSDINPILPELKAMEFNSYEECLKNALALIKANRK